MKPHEETMQRDGAMRLDGVWQIELMGRHGWERFATAFLKDGRYLGGNANHYVSGHYQVSDEALTADLEVAQHSKCRATFGSKKRRMHTRLEARIKNDHKLVGRMHSTSGKKFEVRMRLTRLGDLD